MTIRILVAFETLCHVPGVCISCGGERGGGRGGARARPANTENLGVFRQFHLLDFRYETGVYLHGRKHLPGQPNQAFDGWHADAAFTMHVGTVDGDDHRLVHVAEQALMAGMAAMHPGGHVGDIGAAIHTVVAGAGFGSPHDYCGHGIGRAMHEEPDVPNRGRRGKGPKLLVGSVLALEPMLIAGGHDDVLELDDGWTVVSADGSRTAHVEHTVVVTSRGPEILTKL